MASDAPQIYAALGDSISIDLYAGGPGRGGASLLARNRDDDFPDWHGRDLATTRPELGFALLAADGGTTGSLLAGQLPELASADVAPRIVTLTIGGNDLLAAYGNTRAALQVVAVVRDRVAAEHGAVVADVHGHFLGHGLHAGNPGQGQARPDNRELWYCNIIEPNAWGADAVRAAFWTALRQHADGA